MPDIDYELTEIDATGKFLLVLTEGANSRTVEYDAQPDEAELHKQVIAAAAQFAAMPTETTLQDRPVLHGARNLTQEDEPT